MAGNMSFFWARIHSLLARVRRPARRLAYTEIDDIGLPNQGRQIPIDNLNEGDHGRSVVIDDAATRPRSRVRMAVEPTKNR
ncbi:MAG: hypothetical protein ACXVIH_11350, partial [Ilumatobacteraceae bacterium]